MTKLIERLEFKQETMRGRLAQLVEHLVYTERVIGSSPLPPTIKCSGGVAHLVRAPACHAGGRRFEPGHSRHYMRMIFKDY